MRAKEKTNIYIDSEVKRRALELGLNLSKVSENALKVTIRAVSGAFNSVVPGAGFELATSGHGPIVCSPDYESGTLTYQDMRADFVTYLKAKKLNKRYARDQVSYLDRFVDHPIREPVDIVQIFSTVTAGQQHNLIPALHALLTFADLKGYSKPWIASLKRAIPKQDTGIDLKVPSEEQIVKSMRLMEKVDIMKYRAAYNLAIDSGLRLTEIVHLIKNLEEAEIQSAATFNLAPVGMFRTSKLAYYGFFTDHPLKLMQDLTAEEIASLSDKAASKYVQKRPDAVAYKYLRKFVFDKMIELEIPESVADFIQGRTPKSIGAKHYMVLLRQAKKFYPRYGEYITELRG